MNKSYHLVINRLPLTLTLTSPNQRGYCSKCHLKKEIWVISERQIGSLVYEERKFCYFCALTNLTKLEQSDDKFENKKETVKEIRDSLTSVPAKENPELLELYG